MFELAWESEGRLTLNLKDVPDVILDQMVEWTNQKIEEHNSKVPGP